MSKTVSSLNEDTFFRNYGGYKSNGGENNSGYHYDDYEDHSDED